MVTVRHLALQALFALGYYVALILLVRLSGKRMAGQTTTFDLIVLISLAVVMQTMALRHEPGAGLVFVATVFAVHRLNTHACAHSARLRAFVRGRPRSLIRDGVVDAAALQAENMSESELLAGLRKLGIERPEDVKLAALEETGHISAVAR